MACLQGVLASLYEEGDDNSLGIAEVAISSY